MTKATLEEINAIDKRVSVKLQNIAASLGVLDTQIQEIMDGYKFDIIDLLAHELNHLALVLVGDDELFDDEAPS